VQKNGYQKALSDYGGQYGLLFNTKILDYYKGVPITFNIYKDMKKGLKIRLIVVPFF